MPADKSKGAMGSRRQGDTGPDLPDERNRAIDRAMTEDEIEADFHRGKEPGAQDDALTASRSRPANLNETNADPPGEADKPPGMR